MYLKYTYKVGNTEVKGELSSSSPLKIKKGPK